MKRLTLVVTIALAITLLASTAGLASPVRIVDRMAAAGPQEMIEVVVVLGSQADLSTIKAGPRRQRMLTVERALRARATATQQGVLALLKHRRAQGLVAKATPLWILNGIEVTATPEVIRELATRPEVREIRPNLTIQAPDPITAAAAPPESNVALVNAPALWDLGYRGQGIVVANTDTGVDVNHPDLAGRWRGGTNSWYDPNGEYPTTPTDTNGHGTKTMGAMVGGDAGGTSVGVAPDAKWIAVKIFNNRGAATSAGIHQGFQWLLDPDGNPGTADAPDVVNNSWTMSTVGCNLDFQLDLQNLRAAGILPVFAAGNYGPSPSTGVSPANNPEAFAVGATDNSDVIASFSSRGPSACAQPVYPQLVAPGVGVRSTDLFGLYASDSGTSLAAPHVAGSLALLLSAFPDLSADRQQAALESSAVDLGAVGADNDYGYGRLDGLAAYNWLRRTPDFTLAVSPSSATTTPGGTVSYDISVASVNGFAGDVSLSLSGLPPEVGTPTFTPAVVSTAGSSQLTITTSATAPTGSYPLTVTGTSGSTTHSVSITLVVDAPPDFALSVSPSSVKVYRGKTATYTVSVSPVGVCPGDVTLSIRGLPSGASASFSPNPATCPGTSTLKVKTRWWTPSGTFTLRIIGKNGSLVHRKTAKLTVR